MGGTNICDLELLFPVNFFGVGEQNGSNKFGTLAPSLGQLPLRAYAATDFVQRDFLKRYLYVQIKIGTIITKSHP